MAVTDRVSREVHDLRAELAQLREELSQLRARMHVDAAGPAHDQSLATAESRAPGTTRRAVIGIAAGIAGATVLSSRPAAAANGEATRLGQVNEATQTTEVKYPGSLGGASPRGHVFVAQDGVWSSPASPNATTTAETGTRAAIAGYAGNDAMHGAFAQTNSSVVGAAGGRFLGESAAAYGLHVAGRRATIRLDRPQGVQSAPPSRLDVHNAGEMTFDDDEVLWLCVASGRPGTWRRLAGPTTAGAFEAIDPVRVFDSRLPSIPGSGFLGAGSNRIVPVTRAYNAQGNPVADNVVPVGATAVAFNVTVVGEPPGGFLTVVPGDAAGFTTSTVNWGSGGGALANGSTVRIDSSRRIRLFVGPTTGTHAIIDITGFYR